MIRKLSLTCLMAFFAVTLFAQNPPVANKFSIGGGLSLAVPVNNLPIVSIGTGVDLLAQYGLASDMSVTADVGYTALFGKDNFPSTGMIPIRVGFRFYPAEEFYAAAKIGVGIYTLSNTSTNFTAYSVGAGYCLSPKLDVGVAYEGFTRKAGSLGYLGVRLGYSF